MPSLKISALPAATTPLAGTEIVPIVQGGTTDRATVADFLKSAVAGSAAAPSIAFSADPNTGIFSPTADTFAVATGGTERLRVDSAGNVGIGTASPLSALGFGQSASAGGVTFQTTDTTFNSGKAAVIAAAITGSGNGSMVFETYAGGSGGGERMRLNSAGHLGLGVTPSAWGAGSFAFQIGSATALYNPGSTTQTWLMTNSFFDGTNSIYRFTAAASNYRQIGAEHRWLNAPSGTAGTTISFTQAMTLDASSRLSIGATAAAVATAGSLFVAGTGASAPNYNITSLQGLTVGGYGAGTNQSIGVFGTARGYILLGSNHNSVIDMGGIKFLHAARSTTDENAAAVARFYAQTTAGDSTVGASLVFETRPTSGAATVERVRISSDGNLGLGTASPESRLHLNDASGGDVPRMKFTNGTTGTGATDGMFVGVSNSTQLDLWNFENNSIRFATNNTLQMTLTAVGNLLLKTTNDVTVSVPSGTASVVQNLAGTVIVSATEISIGSPYTQSIQIDIVWNNWGDNVIGIVDLIAGLHQWSNTGGTAFGKVFATNTGNAATFSTFNTTNVTTSQCTIAAVSGGNYTLRITIDPSNNTDRASLYLVIPGLGGTATRVTSVTVSLV